jgi:hypothetical protein
VTWYAFDNTAGTHRRVGETASAAAGARVALPSQLANEQFVMAAISADGGPAGWRKPARVYFKRESGGWKLVGLERHHAALPQ